MSAAQAAPSVSPSLPRRWVVLAVLVALVLALAVGLEVVVDNLGVNYVSILWDTVTLRSATRASSAR